MSYTFAEGYPDKDSIIGPLPLAQLLADETYAEAFRALAHLSRLQVFFLLVRAGHERDPRADLPARHPSPSTVHPLVSSNRPRAA